MVNWRAVLTGLAVGFVLGRFAVLLPVVGHATAGVAGGFVAGWLADEGHWSGSVHGGLAGLLAVLLLAVVVAVWAVLVFVGLVPVELPGDGTGVFSPSVYVLVAVLSAIAGGVGGFLAD